MTQKTILEYLEDKVLLDDHHWGWRGEHGKYGHAMARVRVDGKRLRTPAYRVLYELLVGPIPQGMTLAHQCGWSGCVRPSHVEPKSQRANLLESPITQATINANKTHCVNGHEFTLENTATTHRGARRCRRCEADRAKRKRQENPAWYAQQKEAHREWARKKYWDDVEYRERVKARERTRRAHET